ncbi:MAG: PAS domain-containing protein, partial [Planctomycetota bacterium]
MAIEQSARSASESIDASRAAPYDPKPWREIWRREYLWMRIDAQGRIESISPSVSEILGYSPDEW